MFDLLFIQFKKYCHIIMCLHLHAAHPRKTILGTENENTQSLYPGHKQ